MSTNPRKSIKYVSDSAPKGAVRKKKRKKKKRARTGLIIGLIILAALLITAAVTAIFISREVNGERSGAAQDIVVEIPQGASTDTVAQVLKDNGLITSRTVFKIYCRLNGADGTFQFGEKTINTRLTYDEIIEILKQQTILDVETFTLTFPEGTTSLRMAMMFQDAGICTIDEFIAACNNDTYDVAFFNEISSNENKFIKLEGFLFPDTYDFEVGLTIHDYIQQMLENFEEKVYTDENRQKMLATGMTLEENIILASIVEKESLGDDVYSRVASVFHNRLDNPDEFPTLQSDTSAEHIPGNYIWGVIGYYYNGDTTPVTANAPQAMIDAYDTYKVHGLIVGAICNPGLNAILGTFEPEQSDYYFFITDDNKKFYWGATDADHSRNIATVNAVNSALADGTFDPDKDYSA